MKQITPKMLNDILLEGGGVDAAKLKQPLPLDGIPQEIIGLLDILKPADLILVAKKQLPQTTLVMGDQKNLEKGYENLSNLKLIELIVLWMISRRFSLEKMIHHVNKANKVAPPKSVSPGLVMTIADAAKTKLNPAHNTHYIDEGAYKKIQMQGGSIPTGQTAPKRTLSPPQEAYAAGKAAAKKSRASFTSMSGQELSRIAKAKFPANVKNFLRGYQDGFGS